MVQPNIPAGERWIASAQRTHLAQTGSLTRWEVARLGAPPDLVVWPETLVTTPLDGAPLLRADLRGVARSVGAPIILGAVQSASSGLRDRYRNSAVWIDPVRGVSFSADKVRGVPGIEMVEPESPMSWLVEAALGGRPFARYMEPGEDDRRLDPAFPVVFCYELIFPDLVDARSALAILNLADDTWYRGDAASRQMIAIGALRAIEQRRHVVRVAHGGVSAWIDPFGRVRQTLAFGERGAFAVTASAEGPPGVAERVALLGLTLTGAGLGSALSRFGRR